MLDLLLNAVLERHTQPGESEADVLARIRVADSRVTALYKAHDVMASAAYAEPIIRAAYQLRYQPHYVLQIGDLLHELQGCDDVGPIFSQPRLRHVALCGGPAPEPIALAVLHQQGGGRHLHSTVLDKGAHHWSDCWATSAQVAATFSGHPKVVIDGFATDLAQQPSSAERAVLGQAQVLTLMNAFNELMRLGRPNVEAGLAARLAALPRGALVLVSDQASYQRVVEGFALMQRLLASRGARFLVVRTSRQAEHVMENRFDMVPRLRRIYGQPEGAQGPATNHYRIKNKQLQLAALLT